MWRPHSDKTEAFLKVFKTEACAVCGRKTFRFEMIRENNEWICVDCHSVRLLLLGYS